MSKRENWNKALWQLIEVDETHALMGDVGFNLVQDFTGSTMGGVSISPGEPWKRYHPTTDWLLYWYTPDCDVEVRRILVVD